MVNRFGYSLHCYLCGCELTLSSCDMYESLSCWTIVVKMDIKSDFDLLI